MKLDLKLKLFVALVALLHSSNGKLPNDKGIQKFYRELGCQPKAEDGKSTTHYECSLTQSTSTSCGFRGKLYSTGEDIPSDEPNGLAACRCIQGSPTAKVVCAHIECPEFFTRIDGRCKFVYGKTNYCAIGINCPPDMKPADTKAETPGGWKTSYDLKTAGTCTADGNVYHEGEKYYPEDLPCAKCVCTKEYNGSNSPHWCTDISCNLEYIRTNEIHSMDAPVFFKDDQGRLSCCPIDFIRAPEKLPDVKTKQQPKGPQCSLGKLKLNIGEKYATEAPNTECICEVPPYVTCVQKQA